MGKLRYAKLTHVSVILVSIRLRVENNAEHHLILLGLHLAHNSSPFPPVFYDVVGYKIEKGS